MIIVSSLLKVRILTALMLLVSVQFFVYDTGIFSQANNLLAGNSADLKVPAKPPFELPSGRKKG